MGMSWSIVGVGPLVTVMSRTMGRGRGEVGAWAVGDLMLTMTGILETPGALLLVSEAELCLGGSGGRGGGGVNGNGTGGGGTLVMGDSSFLKTPEVSFFKLCLIFSFLLRECILIVPVVLCCMNTKKNFESKIRLRFSMFHFFTIGTLLDAVRVS